MKEKVSIIIPVYNTEKYLKKCIESLIKQTYSNIEIILINDGSTDNSRNICIELKNKDKRIIFLEQKNKGVSAARNFGLKNAKGNFITFVDSDDYVHKDYVKKMLECIIKYNADICECSVQKIDEQNHNLDKIILKDEIMNQKDFIKEKYANLNNITDFVTHKLFKKSILNKEQFPQFNYSEDYIFLTYVLENTNRVVILKNILYYYLIPHRKYDIKKFSINSMEVVNARVQIFKYYQKKNQDKLMKITAVQLLSRIMSVYKKCDKEYQKVLKYYFKEYYKYALKAPTTKLKKIYRCIKFKCFLLNPNFTLHIFNK